MNAVYFAKVDRLDIEKIKVNLTPKRIDKINRLKIDLDKKRSAGCELLLLHGLIVLNAYSKIEYIYKANGKPSLKNHPNIHFNYSHSDIYSGCVISTDEVGLDMERVRDYPLEKVEKLSLRVMNEKQQIDILEDKNPKERFIQHWVVKESFSKLVGLGMSLPFKTINIDWTTYRVWIDEDKKATFNLKKEKNIYIGITSFTKKLFDFVSVDLVK